MKTEQQFNNKVPLSPYRFVVMMPNNNQQEIYVRLSVANDKYEFCKQFPDEKSACDEVLSMLKSAEYYCIIEEDRQLVMLLSAAYGEIEKDQETFMKKYTVYIDGSEDYQTAIYAHVAGVIYWQQIERSSPHQK